MLCFHLVSNDVQRLEEECTKRFLYLSFAVIDLVVGTSLVLYFVGKRVTVACFAYKFGLITPLCNRPGETRPGGLFCPPW